MAKPKQATREEVRKAILARREARKQEKTAQYAKMRETAKAPAKFAKVLDELVVKTARQADSMEALRHNLGLARIAKDAPAKVRVAAAKNYGKKFIRVAEEQPDILADALQQAYKGLDEQAAAMEIAAEALGIDLGATPAEKAFTDEGKHELELGEDKGEAVAESEGPEFEAKEETEAEGDVEAIQGEPEAEKEAAAGSDAFSTDRDPSGNPKAPQKAKAPEAQGAAEGNKQGSGAQEPTKQDYSTNNPPAQGAEKFVKEIPQAQGKAAGNKLSAMSKKDFIALADAIKTMSVGPEEKRNIAEGLCSTLRASNPRFMKDRFMGYVMGENGPGGGAVKPQGTPRPKKPLSDAEAMRGTPSHTRVREEGL
jgi:hypothetical protein